MEQKVSKKTNEDRNKFFNYLIIYCIAITLTIALGIIITYKYNFSGSFGSQENFGQFGDYVGGLLNPVVAFCALVALLFGIGQQKKELKETRKQFAEESRRQSLELKETREQFEQQSVDGVFFQMLKLHNDMVSSVDSNTELRVLKKKKVKKVEIGRGREIFSVMHRSLKHYYKPMRDPFCTIEKGSQFYFNKIYGDLFDSCQSHLGHYFRYLYNIYQFIERADISEPKKLFYGKLVRAQLSNHELAILYYNCLSDFGNEKFKPLVEKYSLFKNLPTELLLNSDHYRYYEPQAWGGNYEKVKE